MIVVPSIIDKNNIRDLEFLQDLLNCEIGKNETDVKISIVNNKYTV